MFLIGFSKVAASYANLTPEDIAERVSEKYPYQGAVYGAAAGAAAGGAKKHTAKAALVGAGLGAAAGAGVGHGRKAWSKYKSRRLGREISEYNLRATPRRYSYHEED
jgi:DhnA family fructose-bisphosphate aldolase class Ia